MKVHEEQSGDKASENIKLAVLQEYLCDGDLAWHLNLQSSRLTTYDLALKEAINYLRAKQTWTASGGSDPMDLSPLGKGKGGKKGKGKGKSDKSVKPKECFYCGKPGHNKNECRNFSATLFNPTRLVGTPAWKWIPRQAGENLLEEKEQAR